MVPLQIQCIFTKVDIGPIPSFILRADHKCIFTKVDFGQIPSFIVRIDHTCIFTKVDSGPIPSCVIRSKYISWPGVCGYEHWGLISSCIRAWLWALALRFLGMGTF